MRNIPRFRYWLQQKSDYNKTKNFRTYRFENEMGRCNISEKINVENRFCKQCCANKMGMKNIFFLLRCNKYKM